MPRYAKRARAATRTRAGRGTISINTMAFFWAITVNMEEPMLRLINGSFSITTLSKVFRDRIFPKGYQSRRSKTTGRLTAMGLLIRARMKKQRAESIGPRAQRIEETALCEVFVAYFVYAMTLSK